MEDKEIVSAVREFNRFYARQLGVFDKSALQMEYSLAQARILTEIGRRPGCTANYIAGYLDMDRSYVARIIAGFAAQGLLEKRGTAADARKKCLWFTPAGDAVCQEVERRSDERVQQQLAGISSRQQRTLQRAMRDIARIFGKAAVEIRLGYDDMEAAQALVREYTDELHVNLDFQNYAAEEQHLAEKYARPGGCLYVAYVDGEAAGCMAFHALPDDAQSCELKRLYVRPRFRGLGLSRQLMERALHDAKAAGYQRAYLDTLVRLKSAVALYQKLGFQEIPAYYENPLPEVLYFEKEL